MLVPVVGVGLLLTLALLVLPLSRVRQVVLTAFARFARAALLAVFGACGTFLVAPDSAPEWTAPLLEPVVRLTHSLAGPDAPAGLPWLVFAALAALAALPLLVAVELALGLTRQTRLVQQLRTEVRTAAAWVDARMAALGIAPPPPLTERSAAADAVRTPPEPIVLQLMK